MNPYSEEEQHFRKRICDSARAWLNTPYVLGQRRKGAGVDCALLILATLQDAGVIPPDEETHRFSQDWWCHTTDERYKLRTLRYAVKTLEAVTHRTLAAQPGDILLLKASGARIHNHGAICIHWPHVIHAIAPKVAMIDATKNHMWQNQTVEVFSPWEHYVRQSQ